MDTTVNYLFCGNVILQHPSNEGPEKVVRPHSKEKGVLTREALFQSLLAQPSNRLLTNPETHQGSKPVKLLKRKTHVV